MEKWVGHTVYFAPDQKATLPTCLPTQAWLFEARTSGSQRLAILNRP